MLVLRSETVPIAFLYFNDVRPGTVYSRIPQTYRSDAMNDTIAKSNMTIEIIERIVRMLNSFTRR